MKIAVILRDVSFFYGAVIGIDPASNKLLREKLIRTINPSDESALVLALDQKDIKGEIEVTVVSMHSPGSSDLLERGLSLGADNGALLEKSHVEKNSPLKEAYEWCTGLRSMEWDLLLVGALTIDDHADEFGVYLGADLDTTVVTRIVGFDFLSNKTIRALRRLEKGHREIVECELPAVLLVEHTDRTRYPSLRNITAPKKDRISRIPLCGTPRPETEQRVVLKRLAFPRIRPKKGLMEIDNSLSVSDRLTQLFTGGVTEKKGEDNELRGSINELAKKILDHLIEKGFI